MMAKRKASSSTFNIIDAAAFGYRMTLRHWQYLVVAGFLPFVVNAVSTMAILQAPGQGLLMQFIWNLPATMISGWYMFLVMRLATFGERVDRLEKDTSFLIHRAQLMRFSIIIWLLINMVMALIVSYLVWAYARLDPSVPENANGIGRYLAIPNMVLIALCFWATRLTIVHMLAAVDYPIKTFLFKVNGASISFRLLALAIFCFLPAAMIQQAVLTPILPETGDISSLSFPVQSAFATITALFSLIVTAVMTASVADALRQQLGNRSSAKKPHA